MTVFQNACQWMLRDIMGKNKNPQGLRASIYKNTEIYSPMSFHIHPPQKGYVLAMNVFPLKDFASVKWLIVFRDMFLTPSEEK